MKTLFVATLSMALSVGVLAAHHESGEMKKSTVIGTFYADDGTANELLAGNTDKQKIWVDYIQAHNDRNLEKIAEIRGQAASTLPVRMVSDVKGSAFVSM